MQLEFVELPVAKQRFSRSGSHHDDVGIPGGVSGSDGGSRTSVT